MTWQFNLFALPSLGAALVSAVLVAFVWQRRSAPGALAFIALMVACFWWAFGNSFQLLSGDVPTAMFWIKFQYVGILAVPLVQCAFSMQYAGLGRYLTPSLMVPGVSLGLALLLAVWTDGIWHHWMWAYVGSTLQPNLFFPAIQLENGPLFWVVVVFSYSFILSGTVLIVRKLVRAHQLYQRQSLTILIAVFIPWGASFVFVSRLSPIPEWDITPLAFTLSGAVYGWALYRYRMLDLVPAARDAVIENLADAVVVLDAQDRVVDLNAAAERVFNAPEARLIGRTAASVLATRPDLLEQYQSALDRWEVTVNERQYEVRLSPLKDPRTRQTGRIVMLHDITERKQREAELQAAKEAAEAATRAKSTFLANMSHEIRTPMNGIIGMTGLLLDTGLGYEQRDFVETIRQSSDVLLTLINDILDFSKIEAGKLELEQQPFDLRECVESALDLLAVRATEKHLEIAAFFADEVPPALVGDVTRLRQILVNLMGNAIKFTDSGEVVVSVVVAPTPPTDPQKCHLHFSVRDTGIGIPPAQISQLFQSFTQVDSSTTRKYGGTGLGLAISKRLVELMGGQIWVESTGIAGQGTTFHFTLEALRADYTPPLYQHINHPGIMGKRFLLVDDNATNRKILTLQTQTWGALPVAVESGAAALALLRAGTPFDLGLLDMHMPEMDGLMLAEAMRQLETEKGLEPMPLIMLTSLGQRDADERHKLFAALLTKPVRAATLQACIVEVLAAQQRLAGRVVAPVKPAFDAHLAERLPLRILLAEDNVINQKVALLTLSRLGYRADLAANGLEVLETLRRQFYEVVLMDVQMPEMDGLEATQRIRAEFPSTQQPYIIAMTAHAMQGDREICLAAGMNDYVGKPVKVAELCAALEKISLPLTPPVLAEA